MPPTLDLLAMAKDWQAALAGVLVAMVYGFRVWFSAKKEMRTDKEGESSTGAYEQTLMMLRSENTRLYLTVERLSAEVARLSALLNEIE